MSTESSELSGEEGFLFLHELPRKHEDRSFQVGFDDSHKFKAAFRTKMVMYIITLKLNSTLGTTGKATGVKMTAKAVGKLKLLREREK